MIKKSENEMYLLIKYIKSVLWRVAKRLSYTQDTWCLKVKELRPPQLSSQTTQLSIISPTADTMIKDRL